MEFVVEPGTLVKMIGGSIALTETCHELYVNLKAQFYLVCIIIGYLKRSPRHVREHMDHCIRLFYCFTSIDTNGQPAP